MKFKTAQELVRIDINTLSLEQLQQHKVKVLDALRESNAEYGMKQAIMDGYYIGVADSAASGYSPRDMFLTTNLSYIYEECVKRERELLKMYHRRKS